MFCAAAAAATTRYGRRGGSQGACEGGSYLPLDHAFELRCGRHRIRDCPVLTNILMQKIEAPIVLVRIDDEFVVDRDHLGRAILADAVKVNFDAAKIKVEHRSHPLDPLDHASGDGREEQLSRVEGVRPAIDVRVEEDLGVFGGSGTAVRVDPSSADAVFQHRLHF